MKRLFILTLLTLASLLTLVAQTNKEPKGVVRFFSRLGRLIDTLAVKGVDPHYIVAPKRPWQVIVKGNVSQSELKMKSTIDGSTIFGEVASDLVWEPTIKTTPSTYAGVWAGYRGYGLGYSWNVGGNDGSFLTFGATGGSYGVNLRIHSFSSDNPEVYYKGIFTYGNNTETISGTESNPLASPIKTRTLMLDAYYMFNGKRFSYAAAYDQSVIQKRSAGSFMVGAMYYYSHINYANDENAAFILLMDDIGRIKQWQLSIGAGYAYNLVPCRGLLINAMFMPMLTVYDRHKTWRYDSNLRDQAINNVLYNEDELIESDYRLKEEPLSVTDSHSPIALNFDTRLSLTYQWNWLFINAYGQFSRFHFKEGCVKGTLLDWYVNASIGVRF